LIKIQLSRESETHAILCISDNGQGIPEDLDLAKTDTLGLQLVHLLTDQLGGKLTINRANPTAFVLRFPIQRAP
jgi:two-component sensor histidine kinase